MTTEDTVGPQKLETLIDYRTSSVVSRTILNKPTGTVAMFAFGEGEGLSEHTAPYDALVQVLDGRVDISIGQEGHKLATGDWLIMPADVPHALQADGRFKMLLTMIKS